MSTAEAALREEGGCDTLSLHGQREERLLIAGRASRDVVHELRRLANLLERASHPCRRMQGMRAQGGAVGRIEDACNVLDGLVGHAVAAEVAEGLHDGAGRRPRPGQCAGGGVSELNPAIATPHGARRAIGQVDKLRGDLSGEAQRVGRLRSRDLKTTPRSASDRLRDSMKVRRKRSKARMLLRKVVDAPREPPERATARKP